jgi:lipopolysaccharide biosynthesis regulator YciM
MFKKIVIFLSIICFSEKIFSQKQKADSIIRLLKVEKIDSNRVKLLTDLADYVYLSNPDTALIIGVDALRLSKNIKFEEGEYLSLKLLAKSFSKIGNFPRALEINLQLLKLVERKDNPRKKAITLMSIANVYAYQNDHRQALDYYFKSDSIIQKNNINDLKYYSYVNIGDAFDRLNILDSAFLFYSNSKREADLAQNKNLIGASLGGLGNIYRKQVNFQLSLDNYKSAIVYLKQEENDELLCEVNLGLGKLYNLFMRTDSAIYYTKNSFLLAKKDGFLSQQLDAAKFFTQIYSESKNIDSAFAYINIEKSLNDSINSKERIRQSQILSSNEITRQFELAETKIKEEKERRDRLQLLFIGIFIPGFFMLTLFLSRVKLHIRAIKLLGILSLLIFFEYLTLLLHPTVAKLTNHTPIFEIFIFVAIAAILIPLHHRAEQWMIHKLIHHRNPHPDK